MLTNPTVIPEIGTAQSLQAEACKIVPRVEMNPVLLKSGGMNDNDEYMCSVIVLGKQVLTETYGELQKRTTSLRSMVMESHHALAEATGAEVIVIEGAGSCTELNLMDRDIVNLPLVRSLEVRKVAPLFLLCKERLLKSHTFFEVSVAFGSQHRLWRCVRPNCGHQNVRFGARLGSLRRRHRQ